VIEGKVEGSEVVVFGLSEFKGKAREAFRIGIARATLRLLTKVKAEKLSGQLLNVRTGRLRRSINQRVVVSGSSVTGTVGTNVEYAAIHELGGTIKAQLIEAKKAKSLRFELANGKVMFRKSVQRPEIKMPARSFLLSALKDLHREHVVEDEIRKALIEQAPFLRK